MTFCIMVFDMFELRRVLERRYVPIQVPQPLMQRRITRSDIADIALEMLHIHGVEANDGSVETNVCLGDAGTKIVGSSVFGKVSFGAVEGVEEGFDGFFISFLRCSKARFVDPVVDIIICPVICPFNLCSQFLGEKVNALIRAGNHVIELCIEHAADFAGLVVESISSSLFLFRKLEVTPHC